MNWLVRQVVPSSCWRSKMTVLSMVDRLSCFIAAAGLALGAGCVEPAARTPATIDAGSGVDTRPAPPLSRCRAAAGTMGRPRSIRALVDLVNALPRPLELTCMLESFERPLDAHAVISLVSLQPAMGERSPRIFLLSGPLIMSIVPVGPGSALLELGELVDARRSLKGELHFPVTDRLTQASPYEKIYDGQGTSCRFCHPAEEAAEGLAVPPAFVSGAFSPDARYRVGLDRVHEERRTCDEGKEPARCALLRALFDHGEVREGEFPPTVPTIFQQ
jgi:hypothetical protein